uniref:Secreted protein n=1 Tax=Picea sitchensis TaxID=3332 RepID=A0A6B9XUR7_PICSI|nr:hypothetical protein Q903MT_gene3894 [Picea sitchensis]
MGAVFDLFMLAFLSMLEIYIGTRRSTDSCKMSVNSRQLLDIGLERKPPHFPAVRCTHHTSSHRRWT